MAPPPAPMTKQQALAQVKQQRAKLKSQQPPQAVIQYSQPIGPQKKTQGQIAKDAVTGWLKRGVQNFSENARRGALQEPATFPSSTQPAPQRPGGQRSRRGGGRKGRQSSGRSSADEPFFFQPPMMDLGGGIDLSLHPDPMYSQSPGVRRRGEKVVTKTVTRYRE